MTAQWKPIIRTVHTGCFPTWTAKNGLTQDQKATNEAALPPLSVPPPQIEELVCTNEQRTNQWEGFRGWLERRGKQRYNVIIDGANVGYYKANLSEGELADLQQVDWAVKKFQEEVSYRNCLFLIASAVGVRGSLRFGTGRTSVRRVKSKRKRGDGLFFYSSGCGAWPTCRIAHMIELLLGVVKRGGDLGVLPRH